MELWIALALGLFLRLMAILGSVSDGAEAQQGDAALGGGRHAHSGAVVAITSAVSLLIWLGIFLRSNACRVVMQVLCGIMILIYLVLLIGGFAIKGEEGLVIIVGSVIAGACEVGILILLAQSSVSRYTND